MNIYSLSFTCPCLVDDKVIHYTLDIETREQIMVEEIIEFAPDEPSIQEVIADEYFAKFGGTQTMLGTHSGVVVTTIRGSL